MRYGKTERPLAASRSHQVRVFKKLETLVGYLQEIGINQFDVDAANYDPATVKTVKRPDRAVALKRAHEAAAHDEWVMAKVRASLDDPRPGIPHER